jgi:arsenical pump membrane protein
VDATASSEEGVQSTASPPRWRRVVAALGVLDWVAIGLFALGLIFLVTGVLPWSSAGTTMTRIAPILLFLFAVIILAELTAQAQFFDVVAARIAIIGRGSYAALFGLTFAFATITTIFLNLDTTAVLLTPVMLATAARARIAPMPMAMTTVWLANTASLLLPVSNLTNLLAANRVGLPVLSFAERMALPQVAALIATAACLWLFYWRPGLRPSGGYVPPAPVVPSHRRLFQAAALACGLFVIGVLAGVTLPVVSISCAAILVVAFAFGAREQLRWRLIPWRLLVFLSGLFLVVETVSEHGLGTVLRALIGTDGGAEGVWRAAGTSAALSNLINNLPAYLAGEAVIPPGHGDHLLGLLLGSNIGPLILPWASLATLLWQERCRAAGVPVNWRRFVLTGLVTTVVVLAAATGALLLTS